MDYLQLPVCVLAGAGALPVVLAGCLSPKTPIA